MRTGTALTAGGFALIALCYGLARFAFGLFLPAMREDLPLSDTLSGAIAGGAFGGYCLAIIVSAALTERFGPRAVAMSAAVVATVGLALIATAGSPTGLAGAVLFAGLSTGLASPPLAAAVALALPENRRDGANTVINAGTSAGVVLSGPVALLLGADWRSAYWLFAALGLGVALACLATVPAGHRTPTIAPRGWPPLTADIRRLTVAALLTGMASTCVWSFGASLAGRHLGWSPADIGTLWIVIGASGLAGALAGASIRRFGIDATHRATLAALAAGTLCIVHPATVAPLALVGGALFGAAYILLSGVYLVWGTLVVPGRPASGLAIAFLALAIGQSIGAPLLGLLLDRLSAGIAVLPFAVGAVALAALPSAPSR